MNTQLFCAPPPVYQSGNATQEAEFVQGIVEDKGD